MNQSKGTILLTGFPRQATRLALGRFLKGGRRIFLLCSEEYADEARGLIGQGYGEVFLGRCSALDLGLSGDEVKRLQQEVEEVHHLEDSYHGSPSNMRQVLIEGTRSLLEFALDLPRLQRFVHYSSVFSAGWQKGLVVANASTSSARRWHNTYEKIRWESEKWARSAMHQLPITIIRSGLLVGSSEAPLDSTERSFHLLKRFVRRSVQLPLPLPDGGRHPLHICPTDYLLSITEGLLNHKGSVGATFHVTDPTPPCAQEVLLSLGGRIPAEESPIADRLSSWVSRIPGASPPPGAIQAYVSNEIWFELGATRATLEGTTLACPPFAQYSGQLREALGVGITANQPEKD